MMNLIAKSVISGADHRRRRDGILLAPRGGKERDVSNRAREIGEAERGNESVIDTGRAAIIKRKPTGDRGAFFCLMSAVGVIVWRMLKDIR